MVSSGIHSLFGVRSPRPACLIEMCHFLLLLSNTAPTSGIVVSPAFVPCVSGRPVPLCLPRNPFLVCSDVGPQTLYAVVVLAPTQPYCVRMFRQVRVAVVVVLPPTWLRIIGPVLESVDWVSEILRA